MPVGEGVTTGTAQARLTIDYSDLNAVESRSHQTGVAVERNLNRISTATNSAALSFKQLAGSIGLSLGAKQALTFILEADKIATSYRRQGVAAVYLAGSQEKLNLLLETYQRVTGGAVDKATALAQVTRLMAVGFADTSEELEQMVRIARGAALAMGSTQDYILSQLQLALANQTTARLDQIGIGLQEFQASLEKVKRTTPGLSTEMQFQTALIQALAEKFGELADSPEAAATGAEKAAAAFKDTRLAWGELTGVPVGGFMMGVANWLETVTEHAILLKTAIIDLGQAFGLLPRSIPSSWNDFGRVGQIDPRIGLRTGIGTNIREPATHIMSEDEREVYRDYAEAIAEIDKETGEARVDATRQYEEQRTSVIRSYEKSIAREAQDFARQRLRAEQDFARNVAKIRADAARQEALQLEDLTRRISQMRMDVTERIAEWEEEHAETIADLRSEGNERLEELEEDYQRSRERNARQHMETLLGAASRLDAAAVLAEQRRYGLQQQEADEDHKARLQKEQENLEERIQQEEESHLERVTKEREQLNKRILQEQDTYDRLARLRTDDMNRTLEEMQTNFDLQKAQEDEDRRLRLIRMAEDHREQLNEMATQHNLRLLQIREHAAEERQELNNTFKERLADIGEFVNSWIDEGERMVEEGARLIDELLKLERWKAAGLLGTDALRDGSHPSQSDPYTNMASSPVRTSARETPAVRASTVTVEEGAITVLEAKRPGETATEIRNEMIRLLRSIIE